MFGAIILPNFGAQVVPKRGSMQGTSVASGKTLELELMVVWGLHEGLYRDNGKENGNYYLGLRV